MRNAIISVQCEYFKTAQHRNTVHAFMTIGPGLGIWLMPRLLVYIIKEVNKLFLLKMFILSLQYSWQIAWQALSTLYVVSFIMGIFITRRPSDENSSIWSMTGIKVIFIVVQKIIFLNNSTDKYVIFLSGSPDTFICKWRKHKKLHSKISEISYLIFLSLIYTTLLSITILEE